ncbi:LOW QUALITY PROTEIN: large ribosomal subunit protein uL11m [Eudromia elegans]
MSRRSRDSQCIPAFLTLPRGIPVGPFCQDFNARTGGLREGLPLRVRLRGRPDGSYELRIGPPPSSYFLKSVAGIRRGAGRPGHEVAGLVTLPQLYEVALALGRGLHEGRGDAPPAPPPSPATLRRRVGALVGTARSLGLRVLPRLSAEDCAAFQRRRREELEAAREAAAAAEEAARKK